MFCSVCSVYCLYVNVSCIAATGCQTQLQLNIYHIKRYVKRYVKMPCKRASVSVGAPLANLEGIRLPGLFEIKGKRIWVPFLDPEDIKVSSLGAIWNFSKGTGLSWADIRLWDTKGLSIRPGCIGAVRDRTHCKSINQIRNSKFVISSVLKILMNPWTDGFLTPDQHKAW
jgi:hypothetical protein